VVVVCFGGGFAGVLFVGVVGVDVVVCCVCSCCCCFLLFRVFACCANVNVVCMLSSCSKISCGYTVASVWYACDCTLVISLIIEMVITLIIEVIIKVIVNDVDNAINYNIFRETSSITTNSTNTINTIVKNEIIIKEESKTKIKTIM